MTGNQRESAGNSEKKRILHRHGMRRFLAIALIGVFLCGLTFSGCGAPAYERYSHQFLGTFDTVIQLIAYTTTKEEFEKMATLTQERFEELHQYYDRYHEYEGINNVFTINRMAGTVPVKVPEELFSIIRFSIDWNDKTLGVCNIALGPVLELWHDARAAGLDDPTRAVLPDKAALQEAAEISNISDLVLDEAEKSVFLSREGMSLDLGAVAKGYACGLVAEELKAAGHTSFAISGGGNVVTVGAPRVTDRIRWGIGIQDPDGDPLDLEATPLDVAYVTDMAVVSSGDYQRSYTVDGIAYHHLVDPATLMPATHFRAVTVLMPDSGEADFMSTALFLLPLDKARIIAEETGAEAFWVLQDGTVEMTPGMSAYLRDRGGASNR